MTIKIIGTYYQTQQPCTYSQAVQTGTPRTLVMMDGHYYVLVPLVEVVPTTAEVIEANDGEYVPAASQPDWGD